MSEFLATDRLDGEAPTVEGRLADIIENEGGAIVQISEYKLSDSDRALVVKALRAAAQRSEVRCAPVVSIQPMALADGRTDYFVSIKAGDREVTPHVFREKYKAAYHVALYDWLLNGTGEEPDCVEFGPNDWPARSVPAAQASPAYPAEEYAKVAMGNAIEIGRLHIMVQRMERAVKAANVYFGCYVQDEAEEIECCISPEQHEAAKELRDALRIAVAALLDRRKPLPADLPPASDLADAIAAADWSGVSIGNKEFLKAAIIHLRHGASSVPSADCGGGK